MEFDNIISTMLRVRVAAGMATTDCHFNAGSALLCPTQNDSGPVWRILLTPSLYQLSNLQLFKVCTTLMQACMLVAHERATPRPWRYLHVDLKTAMHYNLVRFAMPARSSKRYAPSVSLTSGVLNKPQPTPRTQHEALD